MKWLPLKLLAAAAMLACVPVHSAEPGLIPWPVKVASQPGQLVLNGQTVVAAEPAFTNEAAWLAETLHLPRAAAATENRIWLTAQGTAGFAAEAYQLEAGRDGVSIRAATPAGAFYGCQTLRQLLPPDAKTIPWTTVTDSPRYAWRGLMLDVSRHFFDPPTVLRVLDWMADYKLNRLHLHLTDDQGWRVETPTYPELTRLGARGDFTDTNAPARFFSRADLREIVAYAARRHIVVVPEIDMPGHAGAATRAYPQLDGGKHTFNPAREETFDFLEHTLRDVMGVFPSPWIHFGGDEVDHSQWQVSAGLKAEGITRPDQMEGWFVRRMAGFISQQGRTPMGWDEIAAAKPATNTVVFWWRHNKPQVLKQALAAGYSVVLAPRSPCYFDYPQDKSQPGIGWKLWNTPEAVYGGPEIPADVSAAQRDQILGVEACVWTERISTVPRLEFMLLPRMVALAEMAWTPDDARNYAQFNTRLKPHLDAFRQTGIHYYEPDHPAEWQTEGTPARSPSPAASKTAAYADLGQATH
jgi:hexosaminidase